MAHSFTSIGNRELLSTTVEAAIEDAIRKRIYAPGEKLPSEVELCAQFGVSRTAVREALRMLSARGLVTIEKGRGGFVSKPSSRAVTTPLEVYLEMHRVDYAVDVMHARQIIEPAVAAAAAANRSEKDVEALRLNIDKLARGPEDDHDLLAALDMEFHLHVARASGSVIVPLLLEPIHQLMPAIKKAVYDNVAGARASALEWHARIADAIAAGAPDAAREAMGKHLEIAETHLTRARQ